MNKKYTYAILSVMGILVTLLFAYFFWLFTNGEKGSVKDKAEWSALQVGYEQTSGTASVNCEVRFFDHRGLRSVIMWHRAKRSAVLLNSSADWNGEKMMPHDAQFFISDADLIRVKEYGATSSVLEFLRTHRRPSCL